MFDEDVSLRKKRDLPSPPPLEKKNDDMDIIEGPSVLESKKNIVDDPMEPMDPLDPPPCDPFARKMPLCLCDTLQDVKRQIPARGTFRESKNLCKYQGYAVAMTNMIQAEHPVDPCCLHLPTSQ